MREPLRFTAEITVRDAAPCATDAFLSSQPFMKKIFPLVALVAALQACVSTAPKLSAQQLEAQRTSTLNVYDDNRVGLKSGDQWSWTTRPEAILALEVDGKVFNVKDIESLALGAAEKQKSGATLVTVQLASGAKFAAPPKAVFWLACNKEKACRSPAAIDQADHRNSLDGILSFIMDRDLKRPEGIKARREGATVDPRNAIGSDYRARPVLRQASDEIKVVKGDDLAALNGSVAAMVKAWDAKASERAEKEAMVIKQYRDAIAQKKAAIQGEKIGARMYCERVASGTLEKDRALSCINYGDWSIGDLAGLGWNVVNVATSPFVDAIGMPFTRYGVTLQKVR
ncbi:hypothetical protein AB4Z46_25515 [Variovorax sp. M-6]|uniref:hypothetical protein n=1 Tax=Variovorax sp. M-6 TaxID=3233041 RepID=UPI003F973708